MTPHSLRRRMAFNPLNFSACTDPKRLLRKTPSLPQTLLRAAAPQVTAEQRENPPSGMKTMSIERAPPPAGGSHTRTYHQYGEPQNPLEQGMFLHSLPEYLCQN